MILSKNLKKNNIIIKVKSSNRWDLIEEMLDSAIKSGYVKKEDRQILKNALFEREKSMSTGIGKGVAIPHCTADVIEDVVILLALCPSGIDFESIDSQPVKIIVFLLVPKTKLKQHIKTLANIARIMNSEELREKILYTKRPETIIKTIKEFESKFDA